MKKKISNLIDKIILSILIIGIIITIILLIIKYTNSYKNEVESKETIDIFNEEVSSNVEETNEDNSKEKIEIKYKGYKVLGKVKIPKINIEYPIIEIDDISPEAAKKPMMISIVKYWGGNVNDFGNLSIAGHNNKSGTMFGKTKKLKIGDIIELTDLNGQTIQYSVYDIFATDPNDVSVLISNDENVREVTLITCKNRIKQRLIIKAKEVN